MCHTKDFYLKANCNNKKRYCSSEKLFLFIPIMQHRMFLKFILNPMLPDGILTPILSPYY